VSATHAAAITGYGIEVPGLGDVGDLVNPQRMPEPKAFDPARKLGRKGLLYKDDATKLALCSVQDALTRAGLPVRELHASAPTGVVVSSNLGNVDTVCRIIDTLYAGCAEDLSPMDVPNASSNVIASSIAIRFGCRAINLMLCNGATSGVDALFVAANALKAHRADRMIVVGVEPRNEFVRELAAASLRDRRRAPVHLPLGEGAACVILETLAAARQRNATIYGVIDGYAYLRSEEGMRAPPRPDLWLTPNQAWPAMRALSEALRDLWETEPLRCDLSCALGELYGALGVFQCVAACWWLDQQRLGGDPIPSLMVLVTAGGSWGDGVASLMIRRPV
jgi:3-oxoacyl-[acyl-carrier-protein] synthase II